MYECNGEIFEEGKSINPIQFPLSRVVSMSPAFRWKGIFEYSEEGGDGKVCEAGEEFFKGEGESKFCRSIKGGTRDGETKMILKVRNNFFENFTLSQAIPKSK